MHCLASQMPAKSQVRRNHRPQESLQPQSSAQVGDLSIVPGVHGTSQSIKATWRLRGKKETVNKYLKQALIKSWRRIQDVETT